MHSFCNRTPWVPVHQAAKGNEMPIVERCRLLVAASAIGLIACGSTAQADWASCESKPTRDCVLEEALRGDSGPLAGKDRLDVVIQGGALAHPDYATADDVAEAQRLAQAIKNTSAVNYAFLAIHGLVAANQKQQAIDLAASLSGGAQLLAINETVKSLVKADDLETALALPDRMQPPLDPKFLPGIRVAVLVTAVNALAEIGKTDGALMLMTDQKYLGDAQMADLQMAVAQAFARRGDSKLAEATFDRAQKNLDVARPYPLTQYVVQLRFASITLLALRGRGDAVKDALQQFEASSDASAAGADYPRSQGYQRVVTALLDAKQRAAAVNVASSIVPDAENTKDKALAIIAVRDATDNRLADARAVLSLMGDTQEPYARVAVMRSIAVACAKAGDVASALQLAGEIKNPLFRRGALFLIAQALPR
jgi:hypothetical protein